MLRVTTIHANTAGASARYYTRYLADDGPDGEGHWRGRQANGLGLSGTVSTDDLEALLSGHDPTTGTRLSRALVDRYDTKGRLIPAVAGFDGTFSAPKSLVVTDQSTGDEIVAARDLDPMGALQWANDGRQIFYTEGSYLQSSTRVGRYDLGSQRWEAHTLPVGDGLAAIALDRSQARSFFSEQLVPADECRGAGGSYPSGQRGVCTFAFFTPDSPDECVVDGRSTIEVPDAVGLPLSEALIQMQTAGLNVVGTGTPSGDPTGGDAVVRAQEPPAGARVPLGACVGFRTNG